MFAKPTGTHQFLDPASCHPYHWKKHEYLTANLWDLIGSVQIMVILIIGVISWMNGNAKIRVHINKDTKADSDIPGAF